MIEIDGSYLEGGGQIVRTAIALSALTGMDFRVSNIRKNRPKPGLKAQHLSCIKAAAQLCGASCDAGLGDTGITFRPDRICPKNISIDIGTAGSITLVLQSILLPVVFSGKPVKISLTGGTDVAWSMPVDFFRSVLLPYYRQVADIELKINARGFYPKGQGRVELSAKPRFNINGFSSFAEFWDSIRHKVCFSFETPGRLVNIKGVSIASKGLNNVADRQASMASHMLKSHGVPISIQSQYVSTASAGSGITLWAIFSRLEDDSSPENTYVMGADSLGARGLKAEEVGRVAAEKLSSCISSGSCVDPHTADNLVPLLGLFSGSFSTSKITDHNLTNVYTTEKFLGKRFDVKDNIIRV